MDSYLIDILYTLAALTVVAVMIWLLIKALKGFYQAQGHDNPIRLIRTLPVGSRERLIIFTYRNSEYLIGITANGMNLLDKLPIPTETSCSDTRICKDPGVVSQDPIITNRPPHHPERPSHINDQATGKHASD